MPVRPQNENSESSSANSYSIVQPEQISALASPRRQEILDRLAADGPLTVKQLAQWLGVGPHALYYHLRALCEVDLVIEEPHDGAGQAAQYLYRARARRMMMRSAVATPSNHEPLRRVAAATCEQLRRDYERALGHPGTSAEGPVRNLALTRLVGTPSPEQLEELNACLARIEDILWQSNSAGPATLAVGWLMAPLQGSDDT